MKNSEATIFDFLGFVGEKEKWDSGSTIVQKMHFQYKKKFQISKAILIIRDPYKAIVSFVQYLESGHTGQASPHTFRKKGKLISVQNITSFVSY